MQMRNFLKSAMSFLLLFSCLGTVVSIEMISPNAASAEELKPVIQSVRPGVLKVGKKAKISGKNFCVRDKIYLNDMELPIIERAEGAWTVVIPQGAQSGSLIVRAGSDKYPGPRVNVAPPLQITNIEPVSGFEGTEITISGFGFNPRKRGNSVFIGSTKLEQIASGPTQIRVKVPPQTRTGNVIVRTRGEGEVTGPVFTVKTQKPTLYDTGSRFGFVNSSITIRGAGFSSVPSENKVVLSGISLPVLRANSDSLVVKILSGSKSSQFKVAVRDSEYAVSDRVFQVLDVNDPRISSFSPGNVLPEMPVVIRGANFGDTATEVRVSVNEHLLRVEQVSNQELVVAFPQSTAVPSGGITGPLVVKVRDKEFRSESLLTVQPPQLGIQGFEPLSGPPGTIVTLKGFGFSTRLRGALQNRVKIGDVDLRVISATTNQLQVQIPTRAVTGRFTLSVKNTGMSKSSQVFQVGDLLPVIRDFKPKIGNPGTTVLIEGDRFGRNAANVVVKIGNVQMPVRKMSNEKIQVQIPTTASTGKISVHVGSQGGAVSHEEFVVRATSSSTGFSPDSAPVGAEIRIFGRRFPNSGVKVRFGGTQGALARSVSASELLVQVPTHATSGELSLEYANGEVIPIPGRFTVLSTGANTPPPVSNQREGLAITQITKECNQPGCKVTLVGYGFNPTARGNRAFYGKIPLTIEEASNTRLVVTLPRKIGTSRFTVKVQGKGQANSEPFSIRPN